MNAALYARVSTADKGQDPEVQLRELREYAQRRGWTVEREYVDVGISGTARTRPQLDALMEAARARRVDVIVVWKFDRFARSLAHLIEALEAFKHAGAAFVSMREQVDTDSPVGKVLFALIGAMAEFERDLTVERVRAGLALARARGRQLGRPFAAPLDRRAHAKRMREAGYSYGQISRQLGLPVASVFRYARTVPQGLPIAG